MFLSVQGSGHSPASHVKLPATPHCIAGHLLTSIKGGVQGPTRGGGQKKGREDEGTSIRSIRTHGGRRRAGAGPSLSRSLLLALSRSHSLARLVTPTTSTPVQDNRRRIPPLVFHPAPTHLGRGTQRQFYSSVQGPLGSETLTTGAPSRGLLHVNNRFPVEFQMGSFQQPLQPRTVLHFGSLEFMSPDGSYDMVLLPPRHNDNDSQRLAPRRQPPRRHLPVAEEEHSGCPRHPSRRRRRSRGNRGHAGGGTLSAVGPDRADDAGTPPGDMSGVVLVLETTTSTASPQRASPEHTDDASTLAKDLLGVTLVPEMTVCSVPNTTSPPSIDQKVSSVFHPFPFRFSFDPPSDPATVSAFVRAYPNLLGYHMWST
jgi:hypothetical protein